MSDELISIFNTQVIPLGLMAIMFSLGLSLQIADFGRLLARPKSAGIGLCGQLILLPALAFLLVSVFQLPAAMAVGLLILAACPGGVTSNALVFAARGDVALSVTLTACSSLLTIISTPLIIGFGIHHFYPEGDAPQLDVVMTVKKLLQMAIIPIALGMILRHFNTQLAEKLVGYLRPTSMLVLVLVIGFSVFVSLDLVLDNLRQAGPVAYLLNLLAMAMGLGLALLFQLNKGEQFTLAVEVGVQNATMATFLSLSVLNDWNLAIVPTIYGVIMLLNASILMRWLKR
ncbi:bile acid:sodium symporter family protein [Pseudoteredinibacter isoporae]|uniref:bile acid:sodium symporter family protein n=1 Tax=Pseudoteredinibacter isoporae TaxID=570281 RepID=UPI00310837A9